MKASISKTATIYDLAQQTGLSKTTISDALRGNGRVSVNTRQKVLDAAQQLGYEGNYFAQRLKGGSPDLVPLVTMSLEVGTLLERVLLIQKLLNDRGFDVPIHGSGMAHVEDAESQVELITTLRRQKPKAIICHSYGLREAALQELQRYQEEGGAVVCFGSQPVSLVCDQVRFDATDAVYEATRYLLSLGHRGVGLLPTGSISPQHQWYQGWARALKEAEISAQAEWLINQNAPDTNLGCEDSGLARAELFLSWEQAHTSPRPTALCIINDRVSTAFVSTLLRRGYNVPQDVSVVSYDDTPIARHCIVPLTAMSYPVEQISHEVVHLLSSRIDGSYQGSPRTSTVRGQLSVRNSTTTRRDTEQDLLVRAV